MRLINAIKQKIRERNDPEYIKAETYKLQQKVKLEQSRKELQELKNSTGIRGSLRSGLKAVTGHLQDVKVRNKKANPTVRKGVARVSQSGNGMNGPGMHQGGPGSNKGAWEMGRSSGVFGGPEPKVVKHKRKVQGKTIVIRL